MTIQASYDIATVNLEYRPEALADDLRSALGQMEEILADLKERTERAE